MTQGRDIDDTGAEGELFLLFVQGRRPDRQTIHRFVQSQPNISISLDPAPQRPLGAVGSVARMRNPSAAEAQATSRQCDWLELLRDGLTFDLEGLAPGWPCTIPPAAHRFDFRSDMKPSSFEALRLVPSAHLAGGAGSLPILRGTMRLARELVQHFEQIEAVAWSPAQSLIGRRFFESSITAWLEGGAFPALGLTSFRETLDGGLQSVGLGFIIGQELRIEPALANDKVAATRLGVRLINQLVLAGRIERVEQIIGPTGQLLQLEPSANGKFIRVWGN